MKKKKYKRKTKTKKKKKQKQNCSYSAAWCCSYCKKKIKDKVAQ